MSSWRRPVVRSKISRPPAASVAMMSLSELLFTCLWPPSFQRRQYGITGNRQIRFEPDHECPHGGPLLLKHRCRVTGVVRHCKLAFLIRERLRIFLIDAAAFLSSSVAAQKSGIFAEDLMNAFPSASVPLDRSTRVLTSARRRAAIPLFQREVSHTGQSHSFCAPNK